MDPYTPIPKQSKRIKETVIAELAYALGIIGLILFGFYKMYTHIEDASKPLNRLEAIADRLPDGSKLRSNLYTVLAAEYDQNSEELNQILGAYSAMRRKELIQELNGINPSSNK